MAYHTIRSQMGRIHHHNPKRPNHRGEIIMTGQDNPKETRLQTLTLIIPTIHFFMTEYPTLTAPREAYHQLTHERHKILEDLKAV
jgi:hypothetical protein